jgi:alkanesulfonate monooxygenase SsuD/methylene tetrahydromethanopterin reductase-like flavin-dependent oxidoreductase (luciferase family)
MPNRILRDLISMYRENWAAHRGDADRLNPHVAAPKIAVNKLAFLADTDREAQQIAREAHAVWWSSLTWLARRKHIDLPGIAAMGDYDRAAGSGGILIGSPSTVDAQIEELAVTGINYLICAFQWGSISHAEAMSSMRLFARDIMPRFGAGPLAS